MTDDSAPGWDAIDTALRELYGEREPDAHFGTIIRWSLGGDDPLDGLSAYEVSEPSPHWHIVSYGLTELYQKESDDPETSGFGFELTMRVARDPSEEEPPMWALNFLQNLARYVFQTGNVFADGHHMNINGPISQGTETDIRAIAFSAPPKLPVSIDGPLGHFGFVHVVGITLDELEATQRWNTHGILDLIRRANPVLLTDLTRRSALEDPEAAELYQRGRARDGSSQGSLRVSRLACSVTDDEVHITFGALAVTGLHQLMEGRIRFGREAWLIGGDTGVKLVPGDALGWQQVEGGLVELTVPQSAATALEQLEVKRGSYTWPEVPGLRITVEPSEIRGPNGDITEIVG